MDIALNTINNLLSIWLKVTELSVKRNNYRHTVLEYTIFFIRFLFIRITNLEIFQKEEFLRINHDEAKSFLGDFFSLAFFFPFCIFFNYNCCLPVLQPIYGQVKKTIYVFVA